MTARGQRANADFKTRQVLTSGINGPVQMVLGADGDLSVTEAAGT